MFQRIATRTYTRFTPEQDQLLIKLASKLNFNWKEIDLQVGRKNCKQRYLSQFSVKDKVKGVWSNEELAARDKIISRYGNDLQIQFMYLNSRTPIQIARKQVYLEKKKIFNSGKWSSEELNLLEKGVELHSLKWKLVSEYVKTRSQNSCRSKYDLLLSKKSGKFKWSPENAAKLIDLVQSSSHPINWNTISETLGNGMTAYRCYNRWRFISNPDLDHSKIWSKQEDDIVLECKTARIAKTKLPHRSLISLSKRYKYLSHLNDVKISIKKANTWQDAVSQWCKGDKDTPALKSIDQGKLEVSQLLTFNRRKVLGEEYERLGEEEFRRTYKQSLKSTSDLIRAIKQSRK